MGKFADVEARKPPKVVLVEPSAFADTWEERPGETVAIGLRLVADSDLEDARVEAFRRAKDLFPDHHKDPETTTLWIASFQDYLVRWIIGRGTCDPNDVAKPWEMWEAAPEDMPRDTLSDKGAQYLYDAWERLRIECDIGVPEASDADIALLPQMAERFARMGKADASRCRRLVRFVLEELEKIEAAPTADCTSDANEVDAAEE